MECLHAITLYQPWASLMACGEKQYETRSWSTNHHGWMAIHAGGKWTSDQYRLCCKEPWRSVLQRVGFKVPPNPQGHTFGMPLSSIVAVGRLVDVVSSSLVINTINPQEYVFGDFSEGRFAWLYADMIHLPNPIPVPGLRRIWRLPKQVANLVEEQVGLQIRRLCGVDSS